MENLEPLANEARAAIAAADDGQALGHRVDALEDLVRGGGVLDAADGGLGRARTDGDQHPIGAHRLAPDLDPKPAADPADAQTPSDDNQAGAAGHRTEAQGIDPLEAMARVDSLTDAEARQIADQIEELPAGGGFFVTFLIVVGVIVIILAITDALGYTNVFTFVR